jgi:YHS domain-containing protein/putative intracellular protease/amidase
MQSGWLGNSADGTKLFEREAEEMKRRELLQQTAALSLAAIVPSSLAGAKASSDASSDRATSGLNPLKPPVHGPIPVAFLISQVAAVIDFCGPWEVFQDASVPGHPDQGFQLYTVAETPDPIEASGGMKITPHYTLETAPRPKVVVIPAQSGESQIMVDWIRKSAESADLVMSVCTGAYLLANTGLLSGKAATTHHDSYRAFARRFPDIQLKRGVRFVEEGNLATAGGLTSGIDLALRVVERYYGSQVAKRTAYYMEYQGLGWMNESSNSIYAKVGTEVDNSPYCLVCGMDVDPQTALSSSYKGKTYYFCMAGHKQQFDATPEKFVKTN